MKKRLVLKEKPKKVLKFAILSMVLATFVYFGASLYRQGVNDCVEGGNSRSWCEVNL